MNYKDSLGRLKKLSDELKKEEGEIKSENEKSENEINELRKNCQEKIGKILEAKKKKLKIKEAKVLAMQNEKMQIVGGLFIMHSRGEITKEEMDKVNNLESVSEKKEEIENKDLDKKTTAEETQN